MRNLFTAFFFSLSGVLAAQPSSTASDPVARAAQALAAGNYAAARDLLRTPEAQNNPAANYYLARCLEALGDTAGAVTAYEQFLSRAPSPSEETREAALRLAELRAAPQAAPASAPTFSANAIDDPETPTRPEEKAPRDLSGWRRASAAAIGLGGTSALIGLMFRAVANDRALALNAAIDEETRADLRQQEQSARITSITTLSAGGALILGGTLTLLVTRRLSRTQIALSPSQIQLAFSF
jgi:tetratricopeptide (TPR) repeat protein